VSVSVSVSVSKGGFTQVVCDMTPVRVAELIPLL